MECESLMARAFNQDRSFGAAAQWVAAARRWLAVVEHANTRTLFETVADEVGEGDFIIRAAERTDVATHEKALHDWLINQAQAANRSESAVAKDLGITRATLAKWRKLNAAPPGKPSSRRRRW
jgi:hypothetical protein